MKKLFFVQMISFIRAIVSFFFVTTAFTKGVELIAGCFYIIACVSDLLDGFLAKRWKVTSVGGNIVDLMNDKFLTISSAIYLMINEFPLLPGILIVFREVVLMSFRQEKSVFKTNRFIGGVIAGSIWLTTLAYLLKNFLRIYEVNYLQLLFWFCGIITTINILVRTIRDWGKIKELFKGSS